MPVKKKAAPKKIKVEALSKELKTDVKELLSILKDLDINAKTKASSIDEESAKLITELIKSGKSKKQEPAAVKTAKAPAEKASPEPAAVIELPPAETAPMPPAAAVSNKIVALSEKEISVKDLAARLEVRPVDLIKQLLLEGILATINQRINFEIASKAALKLGIDLVYEEKASEKIDACRTVDKSKLVTRPPIVTVMGHVDHGKTKLLDAIRKTNVIDTEAGGITQHIGAYQVEINGRQITFLDTPGHEAFTALRARGANVTDIVVLVVAADDGIMPQTKEAIDHAKASNVPIIVAINKIDKPDASPDRVKQQLSEFDLTPEEWGGSTVTVGVSALKGTGIESLLEMILLMADMQELKANPSCPAAGVIIESYMDKSMGPVATVIVQEGTLRVGDAFYSGGTSGKIRALINDKGKRISKAGPAFPIKILGISSVPQSGDVFKVMPSEKEARTIAEQNSQSQDQSKLRGKVISLEDFSQKVKSGDEVKGLNLIIKADVHGSQEALVSSLEELSAGNIKTNIIRNSTGNITQGDIMLSKASEAIIVGFNVDFEGETKALADSEGVDVRMYSIIYEVIDDIKMALEGMLEPEYEEAVTAHAAVRQMFKYSKVGTIAGCIVSDGKVVRGSKARVLRNSEKIAEGAISTLKRFKDDVKEVAAGLECGITISNFDGLKVEDVIEQFEMRVKKKHVKA
ncbi:MAG: translation initiation factor IF-2 [Candidatus Margulisiibacteriota bacterium]